MRPPFTDSDTIDDDDEPLPGAAAPPDAEIIPFATPPAAGCGCPVCAAQAAMVLLDTGRPGMAATLLRPLPEAIRAALGAAYENGVRNGRRPAAQPPQRPAPRPAAQRRAIPRKPLSPARAAAAAPSLPRKPRPHEMLDAALVAGRTTPERVAEVLGCRPGDVPAIAAGRVTLAPGAWSRLLDAIADDQGGSA